MPRALSEKEKLHQYQKLLEKGKGVVFSYGIRKVSVDDITKAAGMAKGTFYQHFDTKEAYLMALIKRIHQEVFANASQIFEQNDLTCDSIKERIRGYLSKLFTLPEILFFIQNEQDIKTLLESIPYGETQNFKQMEEQLFADILHIAGINTEKVKSGIVHNYVHTLSMMRSSELMIEKDLPETAELVLESLIEYIFKNYR